MKPITAIATVVVCTLLGGLIGLGLGFSLIEFAPDYCTHVGLSLISRDLDSDTIVMVQELHAGLAGGVVTGIFVVAFLCWRESRLRRDVEPSAETTARPLGPGLLWVTGKVFLFAICLGGSLLVGLSLGEDKADKARYQEERTILGPALAADPAFSSVRMSRRSYGGVSLFGTVARDADLERLKNKAVQLLGEGRGKELVSDIRVRE
jgi:hypothetical protein